VGFRDGVVDVVSRLAGKKREGGSWRRDGNTYESLKDPLHLLLYIFHTPTRIQDTVYYQVCNDNHTEVHMSLISHVCVREFARGG
jgi:hypothetical protein